MAVLLVGFLGEIPQGLANQTCPKSATIQCQLGSYLYCFDTNNDFVSIGPRGGDSNLVPLSNPANISQKPEFLGGLNSSLVVRAQWLREYESVNYIFTLSKPKDEKESLVRGTIVANNGPTTNLVCHKLEIGLK